MSSPPSPPPVRPPVVDLHSDILLRVIENGVSFVDPPRDVPGWPQVTIPTLRAGGVTHQVFAVWVDETEFTGPAATTRALAMIDAFHEQAAASAGAVALATTMAQADAIVAAGGIAGILWVEGGEAIDCSLENLRAFHRRGVRGMTLTWTRNLPWAGSANDRVNPQMGLTEFGREVAREMNRLGMVIDLSHASDRTAFDVLEVSTAPVVLSHSCCRALCDRPRNASDAVMRAVAQGGGVLGVCVYPMFLSLKWEAAWDRTAAALESEIAALKQRHGGDANAPAYRMGRRALIQSHLPAGESVTIEDYLDHIDHALAIMGPEHVALGSDFDGIWAFPACLETAADWPAVAQGLRRRGHAESVVRGVMGGNAARLLSDVLA